MSGKILFSITAVMTLCVVMNAVSDRDDFNSTKLGEKWIWDNPAKDSSYDLKEKPGWLKITCAPGDHDIWDVRSGGPAMLLEAPSDNYTFETHYVTEIRDNCSVGIVFLNEDAVGNANSPGPWCALFSQPTALYWQHAVAVDAKQANVENINDVFVKVEKEGNNWKFYYKAKEGDKWQLVIEDTYDIGKKHYAGLMVKNWNPGPEISAYYDYVETSWPFASAVDIIQKLTTTWGRIRKGIE